MLSESSLTSTTSSKIAETVIEKFEQLSVPHQQEILDFVEFLLYKQQTHQTIWDKIEEIVQEVPEELWDDLPIDGAQEHDHYLYGTPKKGL